MNDVFRYPDNKARIELNFFWILPRFTKEDLEKIQNDIKKFDKLFYLIGEKILNTKYGPRPTLNKLREISKMIDEKIKNN